MTLAIDSFVYFYWYQFGQLESIHSWIRYSFPVGLISVVGMIIFFISFTGFDKRKEESIFKIKVKHFQYISISWMVVIAILSLYTDTIILIPENPKHIGDFQIGMIGKQLFTLSVLIFLYLFSMVYHGYKSSADKPSKQFILLIASGIFFWSLSAMYWAYTFQGISEIPMAINYTATSIMAVIFFIAIVNYQSGRLIHLNLNLENIVTQRTSELNGKNVKLKQALSKLKRMQKQIIVQEKMASMGFLTAGIAHEIRNPLNFVTNFTQLSTGLVNEIKGYTKQKNTFSDTATKTEILEIISNILFNLGKTLEHGRRAENIVHNMLMHSKKGSATKTNSDINKILEDAVSLASHGVKAKYPELVVDVEKSFDKKINTAKIVPQDISRAFINIITNALFSVHQKSINSKGQYSPKIEIKTEKYKSKKRILIRDNGVGIKKKNINKIFEPFFTTNIANAGTGLGLSICYDIIVQEHNGKLTANSTEGEFAEFIIEIP